MTKPQIIDLNGRPAFVVIPIEEWRRIQDTLGEAGDKAAVEAFNRGGEEAFPIAVADALIAGENPVKVYRKYRETTAFGLAVKCGISSAYLSQIESGKRRASADVLKKLADALDVSMDDLV